MPEKVILNIYDVTSAPAIKKINDHIGKLGTGAFHGAVQVYSEEWSYGFCDQGSGVFNCPPRGCDMHHYRESLEIGETTMSQEDVMKLVEQLETEWPGSEYDLLKHNCCVFSSEMCQRLGVGPVPGWVTNLAAAGATVQDGAIKVATVAQSAAIIAAAKAGRIDEKYNLRGTAQAKAREFMEAANGIDKQYKVEEKALQLGQQAVKTAQVKAQELVTRAQEMDDKYHIKDKAQQAAAKASGHMEEAAGIAKQKGQQLFAALQRKSKHGDGQQS
mmetsp:Transcript_72534/g.224228  ORF Transcript_72534/g.224228 Transcript_72534/m.224228 type:complete len:273 (-) Transcript_72534:88-906(-)